jgi:membrane protein YdbS with pleckstrin-like domain
MTMPPLEPLERGQLQVMRVHDALGWALVAVAATGGNIALHVTRDWPLGVLTAPAVLLGIVALVWATPRRWRHWGYAFTGRELHVAHGWWTRSHTVVPVSRVQHIDVTQGPIQRAFGVATLVLHTAGTANSLVSLPGIARATAEGIRDAIRAQLSGDA